MNDMLLFSDHEPEAANELTLKPWDVLVVDDEEDVHAVTTLALTSFEFDNRRLNLLHAYSAKEAKQVLKDHPNIALVLLDVVMETDQAGLELASFIRQDLKNHKVRIVLRTGQPGEAPEHQVIRDFDINDYKNKTELTSVKLYTTLYSNLRSYRDIITVIEGKLALERLIKASRGISSRQGIKGFVRLTVKQLEDLLNFNDDELYCYEAAVFTRDIDGFNEFLFKSGQSAPNNQQQVSLESLPDIQQSLINQATSTGSNAYQDQHFVLFCNSGDLSVFFYGKIGHDLTETDQHILNIFTENLTAIAENIRLYEVIDSSQKELIYRLGEVVESRSNETGYHVKRVAYYSALLGELIGLPEDEVTLIHIASPLHDIGKIAIPDAILNKPAKLAPDEWEIMKTHALKGFNVLNGSGLALLDVSATIALTHHEKWDGSGYPRGLAHEHIHIYGRITAIADVFDALGSDRCYKVAWPLEKIIELFKAERGKHFDPRLIDLLLDNLDRFLEIRDNFTDEYSA